MKLIKKSSFEAVVEKAGKPVIVSFVSPDCKPCNLMKPDLEALEKEYGGLLSMARVDVAEDAEIAERFSVVSTPTIIMFSGGKPVLRVVGYATRHDLKQKIDNLLKCTD